ncbi:MAG: hypothetical protein KY468_07605 [Armatimonadetes bacterium]|nr:hypothetical protein [Armatimonadota bacterium]
MSGLLATLCLAPALAQTPGTIVRIAGSDSSTAPDLGDGGPALDASIREPRDIAFDQRGHLFIVSTAQHRIRVIDTEGIIRTFAGSRGRGYSGDGGPATEALLDKPSAVAVDRHGNLFIADTGNHCIRKVAPDGTITTVAGRGRMGGFSGDGGDARMARLYAPRGVAVDGQDRLYIADSGNHRIRSVDQGIITTYYPRSSPDGGGDGHSSPAVRLSSPHGLALDSRGNLYISDYGNFCVRRINPLGEIVTIAGGDSEGFYGDGGPAVEAFMGRPVDVEVDRQGNLFIADETGSRIRKVDNKGIITTVAGNGGGGSTGDGGPAVGAEISWPAGVSIDASGHLFLSDSCYGTIRKVFSAAAPGYLPGSEPGPTLRGDVTTDGTVDIRDAVAVLNYGIGRRALTPQEEVNADLNFDFAVDVRDAVLILKMALES